jgi:hypothetical protein
MAIPTQKAWVSPQFINQPKPGKKKGSIKDNVLGYVWMDPDALNHFKRGQRIYIEYSDDGNFKNLVGFPNPAPHQVAPQPQQMAPAVPRQAPPPRPMQPNFPAPATDVDPTAMNIFVTGIVGRALGSGHFQAQDISQLTLEAKRAFMKHLSGKPTSDPEGEFDDPLPTPDSYGVRQAMDDDPSNDTVPF